MRTPNKLKRAPPAAKPTLEKEDLLPIMQNGSASSSHDVAVSDLSSPLTVTAASLFRDACQYQLDFWQRSILFLDGDLDFHKPRYVVGFEERQVEQIHYSYPEKSFEKVQKLSEQNEALYKTFVSPWVTAFANPFGAEALKWLHPMRVGRYMFSEKLNPWMLLAAMLAPAVNANRAPAGKDNIFGEAERATSAAIVSALQNYQRFRDAASERLFAKLYG